MDALTVDFTPSIPDQIFTTQWGSVTVQIEAHWNDVGAFWSCVLARMDTGAILIAGLVLSIDMDLLAPYFFGLGQLVGANTVDGTNPTLASLGRDVIFYWIPPS